MSSVLKVDKLDPQSGTALEIGTSGDTITIPSGATIVNSGTATGFGTAGNSIVIAGMSGDQTGLADNVFTKIVYDVDTYDPDGLWDTTNARYTAPAAGRYLFLARAFVWAATANGNIVSHRFYKNGSALTSTHMSIGMASDHLIISEASLTASALLNLAENDYIEYFVQYNMASGTATCDDVGSEFMGFRLD